MSIDWGKLGIEPTKDKDVITKAYRSELKKTNPEDDPEGFKELRKAYEAALEYAKADDSQEPKDKTEVDLWVDSLVEIYDDFQKRIDPQCWKQALTNKVCESIESSDQAFEGLMNFLMEHYYLPQKVWAELDARFDFLSRHDELCENWPAEFVDYVIVSGITNPENIPFNMFEPGINGAECDKLRRLYFKALSAEGKEALDIIANAEELSESHPYIRGFKNSLIINCKEGNVAAAIAEQEELYKKYPEDLNFRNAYIRTMVENGYYDKCEAFCKDIIAEGKGDLSVLNSLAEVLVKQDRLEDAYDAVNTEMKAREHSIEVLAAIHNLRSEIADKILEDISVVKKESDSKYYMKLVWYTMSASEEHREKAEGFAEKIDPSEVGEFEYNYVLSAIYSNKKQYDKLVECNDKLIKYIETHPDETDNDGVKLAAKLPGLYCGQIESKYFDGKYAGAEMDISAALSEFPDNDMVLISAARTRYYMENYQGTRDAAKTMLKANNYSIMGWYFLGLASLKLYEMREAYDAGNKIIQMAPYEDIGYVIQLRVLEAYHQFDDMKEILDFMNEQGVQNSRDKKYFEAVVKLGEQNFDEEAFSRFLDLYEEIKQIQEKESKPIYAETLEERLTELYNEKVLLLRRKEQPKEAIEELKKSCELLEIPLNRSPLFNIYRQFGMWDEIAAFLDANREAEPQLVGYSEIETELSKGNAEKARELYDDYVSKYGMDELNTLNCCFMRIAGDLKAEKEYWKNYIKAVKRRGGNISNPYMSLAFVEKRLGDKLSSRRHAKQSLELSAKQAEENPQCATLYKAQMILCYAVLGDFDKATAQLQEVRGCSLCNFCEYSECKDSYIFEMLVEMLKGNYEKAHELARFGMKRWPDDLDFYGHECQMRALGV